MLPPHQPSPSATGAADAAGDPDFLLGPPSAEFLRDVPIEFARDHLALSEGVAPGGRERVAMTGRDGDDLVAHNLAARLGREVSVRIVDAEPLARAIDALARERREDVDTRLRSSQAPPEPAPGQGLDATDIAAALAAEERDLLRTTGRAPVVKLVHGLLFEALGRRASDIHIQPTPGIPTPGGARLGDSSGGRPENGATSTLSIGAARASHGTGVGSGSEAGGASGGGGVVIRYRIDGALVEAHRLPRRLLDPIVGRVKVMAQMDIAERRLPQDGRAAVTIGGQEIDLRVSSLPTALGERLVIRLLDKRRTELFDLERLGMPAGVRRRFEALCERPHGMILVTGPTGSGKTTTLYSALLRLNRSELNILTLEDPIEYELPGISQSQINPRKGVTFGTGLRHVLRQDPDVIMVGEIRDAETARIAVQSALTGHLVFSTLHTNSAASAVTRLVDLGVEPYLINAALTATLAQRLVRTLCEGCRGAGCERCAGGGFRGRLGLYELLVMDPRLRELVAAGASASDLHDAAVRAGMQTLREGGLAAVAAGLTTRSEVDRVTLVDEAFDEDIDSPAPTTVDLERDASQGGA